MILQKLRRAVLKTQNLWLLPCLMGIFGCGGTVASSETLGEIKVSPDRAVANGQMAIEVSIQTFTGSDKKPLTGAKIEITTSRNTGGAAVDQVEQPTGLTDADGRAVAYVGSSTTGDTKITATANGQPLCESIDNGTCVLAQKVVTFYTQCPDADKDGHTAIACGGDDCNDNDSAIHPGAAERCNEVDDNCDGQTDEEPEASASCNDNDACNGVEVCNQGHCADGSALDCEDNNACTDDSCDASLGCQNVPNAVAICDDGNSCTKNDACSNGTCAGTAYVCDDGNPCTDDACNGTGGCLFNNNTAACNDDNPCTTDDVCGSGTCAGTVYSCDDSNPCTDNVCNGDGSCSFVNNTASCDDGIDCTYPDTCADGGCIGTPNNTLCDDGKFCTLDVCDVAVPGCTNAPSNALCDDRKQCTTDTCDGQTGTCSYETTVDPFEWVETLCDGLDNDCDGCIDEGCAGYEEPIVAVEVIPYSDGPGLRRISGNGQFGPIGADLPSPMTVQLNDDQGHPIVGELVTFAVVPPRECGNDDECDDQVDCTTDTCDTLTGKCVHATNNSLCPDDGSVCNGAEVCTAFGCWSSGDPCASSGQYCDPGSGSCAICTDNYQCDDGRSCTVDTCDTSSGSGVCVHTPDNNLCASDGLFCNGSESCNPSSPGSVLTTGCISSGNPCAAAGRVCDESDDTCVGCYGAGGMFACSLPPGNPSQCPMEIQRACNAIGGTFIGETSVRTDANGQASARLRFPPDTYGMTVVRAAAFSGTANEKKVYFFASSVPGLSPDITLPTLTSNPTSNPGFGPMGLTARPLNTDPTEYFSNFNSYTLAITSVSASTGSSGSVSAAPLAGGGTLTISGVGFADTGNMVWVGGVLASIVSESSTEIIVNIPEGLPGAASIIVTDGSTTPFQTGLGDSGNVPSVGTAPAQFYRLSSKPIFIYAATGSRPGSTANVRLIGYDQCRNPLPLTGHTISLTAINPGDGAVSTSVTAGAADPDTGIAVVSNVADVVRSAIIVGTIDGISSNDLAQDGSGNMVVSTVPSLLSPDNFLFDPALGNNDGVNSLFTRGGDESNPFDALTLNPGARFLTMGIGTYTIPDGQSVVFETEAHLLSGTITGEGDMINIFGGGQNAVAGTVLGVISGGSGGLLVITSVKASTLTLAGPGDMAVPALALPGWLRQGADQEMELNYGALLSLGEPRQALMRVLVKRLLP